MFDETSPTEDPGPDSLDALLRQGLREMPSPVVSSDFDSRVLQAIQRLRPWWWIDWQREGMSLVIPGAAAAFACFATLGVTLWTGGAGPIRISPNRVVQSAIQATLQAADTGQVSPTTLLLRSPKASAATPPATLPADAAPQPVSDKHKR